MANERALGLSFIYAAQTWRQLVDLYGEHEARALFGLTNVLVIFGGGKDVDFNQEISDLIGTHPGARAPPTATGAPAGAVHPRRGHPAAAAGGDPPDAARPGAGRSPRTRRRPSPV